MARRRSAAEGIARHVVAWSFCAVYIPLIVCISLLLPRDLKERVWPKCVRGWGKGMLRISGVRMVVHPDVQARLADRQARVLVFNHSSTLDTFVGAALLPEGGVLVLKREFIYLPFLGLAAWALGSIMVNRSDGEKGRASLARAIARTRARKLQLMISPEGTRVKGPTMGRFKLGAFRLGRDAEIPLMPLVWHGCAALWPHTAFAPEGGTVFITAMPDTPVTGADHAALRAEADALRERFIEALAAGPGPWAQAAISDS